MAGACTQILGDGYAVGGGPIGSGGGGGIATTTGGSAGDAGAGGIAPSCADPIFPGNGAICDQCIRDHCCAPAVACLGEAACAECVRAHDPDVCGAVGQEFYDFNQCWATYCAGEACFPGVDCNAPVTAPSGGSCFTFGVNDQCNPITADGCNPGDSCLASSAGFYCAGYPVSHGLCEACDNPTGIVCGPMYSCFFNTSCARYCCNDGDCGGGTCLFDISQNPHTEVGLCVEAGAFWF